MMRRVLLRSCSREAVLRALSIAMVLRFNDPNTMAAITATSAVASNTSTRVNPRSERCTLHEYIGADLEHFVRRAFLPQNLYFYFPHRIQRCRGDNAFP